MAFDKVNEHVVAESSLIKATYTGRLVNMVDASNPIDNGKLVTKGAYSKDEVYEIGTPATGSKVYLTLQVPLIYESYTNSDQDEKNFYNAAGDIIRTYPLEEDDIFTVSKKGITALATDPVVGNLVVANGRDIKEVAAATDVTTYGFVGKIIKKVTKSDGTSYRIEVIKNKAV